MMHVEPFYFGPPTRRLFGLYHARQGSRNAGTGIVLCYPMGQEYLRAHRTFLQLARQLAWAGFDVLRFDYGGCGDSQGDEEQAGLTCWREDIARAVTELKEGADTARLCLVGLRLGATLALLAAMERPVDYLVLWNPICDGREYLDRLRQDHAAWLAGSFAKPHRRPETDVEEVLGFALTGRLTRDLNEFQAPPLHQRPAQAICLLDSTPTASGEPWRQMLAVHGRVDYRHIPAPEVWVKQRSEQKGLVPEPVLRHIVDWLCEVAS